MIDSVKNKPASLLVGLLGKALSVRKSTQLSMRKLSVRVRKSQQVYLLTLGNALSGIPSSWCGRQMAGTVTPKRACIAL